MNKIETIKEVLKVASIEKKRSGKNYLKLVFDIINSRKRYGTIVCDYMAYGFSMLDEKYRDQYFSSHKLIKVVNMVNDRSLDSKWTSYKLLKDYYHRDVVNLKESDDIDIIKFLSKHQEFFAKTLDGSGGYGVKFINQKEQKDILNYLKDNNLIMLEEAIIQHETLNKINPSCINTLRIASILGKDGSVAFLPCVLRVGGGTTKIDNVSSGGTYTLIDNHGRIALNGYYQENLELVNNNELIIKTHPTTNINPFGIRIPYYKESLKMVKEMAKKLKTCPIVGWDIAISKDGPMLLEFNAFPGLDMNQNYYFIEILNKEHVGAKEVVEKQLNIKI